MKNGLVLFLLLSGLALNAQNLEAGLLLGGSNYRGDLSENSQRIILSETGGSAGAFLRWNVHRFVSLRLGFQFAQVGGTDANARDEAIRTRNLSFRSNIFEGMLGVEWNILGYQPYNLQSGFSPYLFGGVALFGYNPVTDYQGSVVRLQPLGTEGQGMPGRPEAYKKSSLAFPVGIGFKYALNDKLNIGLELGVRLTKTDYIDDVSTTYVDLQDLAAANGELAAALSSRTGELQGGEPVNFPTGAPRGDDQTRDLYFIGGVFISYNFLDNGLVGARGRFRGKRSGCKTD